MKKLPAFLFLARFGLCICALLWGATPALPGEGSSGVAGLSREAALRAGERIYREGILPSGEPVGALIQGDVEVDGTMFTCLSCHLRSGLGSYEGLVLTTPTNGAFLYEPRSDLNRLTPIREPMFPYFMTQAYKALPRRPAYTDETLAVALQDGVDPSGRTLNPVMPRYLIDGSDMDILVYYLKSLSAEPSPGVTDTTLSFATVITEDVGPAERDAMLEPWENFVRGRSHQAKAFATQAGRGASGEARDIGYRSVSLARWELKGPPGTWRAQLEDYYRRAPVFALLGGISHGEWRPIHEFCEEHRIPCLFPITDLPVISKTDWYTLYFSKGLYQEGEAAARFLATTAAVPKEDKAVVQVFRDSPEARALSSGFDATWRELGRPPPVNRIVPAGEAVTKELLEQVTKREKPAVLVLWVGAEGLPALEAFSASENRPPVVCLSSTLLQQDLEKLPEQARSFTYLTYPYATLAKNKPSLRLDFPKAWQGSDRNFAADRGVPSGMFRATLLLSDALMMMGANFYRDRLLEVIDMFQDKRWPHADYERLSFGPGQRYASKGCFIVQLTEGDTPRLVAKSEWVIH